METVIGPKARVLGRELRELKFPKGALLGGIVRGEEVIMPRGGDALRPGDRAVFFVLPEAIESVEKLLR